MEWMLLPLRRYAQFSGRSRRREFWMWVLFVVLVSVALSLIDRLLGLGGAPVRTAMPGRFGYGAQMRGGGVLTGLFALAVFLPNLAVQIRRLHDTDRRGWWILLPAAPYAAGVVLAIAGVAAAQPVLALAGGVLTLVGLGCAVLLLVWLCLDGTTGPNRFGEDPKGPADLGAVFD